MQAQAMTDSGAPSLKAAVIRATELNQYSCSVLVSGNSRRCGRRSKRRRRRCTCRGMACTRSCAKIGQNTVGKRLAFQGSQLDRDLELVGSPEVCVALRSNQPDGIVIAYLEDVAPDGRLTYLTEGELRPGARPTRFRTFCVQSSRYV
jgi:hypothetical protein